MATSTRDKQELIGEPLAAGEYTDAPNPPSSVWHITPEQEKWVENYNKAVGIMNVTGDRTMLDKLLAERVNTTHN